MILLLGEKAFLALKQSSYQYIFWKRNDQNWHIVYLLQYYKWKEISNTLLVLKVKCDSDAGRFMQFMENIL